MSTSTGRIFPSQEPLAPAVVTAATCLRRAALVRSARATFGVKPGLPRLFEALRITGREQVPLFESVPSTDKPSEPASTLPRSALAAHLRPRWAKATTSSSRPATARGHRPGSGVGQHSSGTSREQPAGGASGDSSLRPHGAAHRDGRRLRRTPRCPPAGPFPPPCLAAWPARQSTQATVPASRPPGKPERRLAAPTPVQLLRAVALGQLAAHPDGTNRRRAVDVARRPVVVSSGEKGGGPVRLADGRGRRVSTQCTSSPFILASTPPLLPREAPSSFEGVAAESAKARVSASRGVESTGSSTQPIASSCFQSRSLAARCATRGSAFFRTMPCLAR